ncbi:MAG: Efflux transporter, RND family, MFP subunit [candidate division TM6 bacterium GW2011_GWF2_30_66]|nr:MAG: Efflux transporter, RND family, MFP subunit [candidate division TM6 bacterium GW2011_GWF2_30_66]
MNLKKILWLAVGSVSIASIGYYTYKVKTADKKQLYKTKKFTRTDIIYTINATGAIEAENTIKVGSLINGVVKELYVEENQNVQKGQIIALLDNGKGNTDVKAVEGAVKRSQAALKYAKVFLDRQKTMYSKGHISQNDLDQAQSQHDQAYGTLKEAQANYEKASIDYNNTKILSPINGVIVKKGVSVGEAISSFFQPTVLYTIAQDLTKMKVELEIDETSIGDIKVGYNAILTFDTYPNKTFEGLIDEISNGATISKGTVTYKSYVYIDNNDLLLRPSMTVHASIVVASKKNIFAVPGYIFSINPEFIKFVAQDKKYKFEPISQDKLDTFKKAVTSKDNGVKTIWVVENNAFIEKAVEVGITDKINFEIVSGVNENEEVLIDVEESDAMKLMFKRMFGGGMSK